MSDTVFVSGTLINRRYRIDALLGQGGMGVVYRAYDLNLSRAVALKTMRSQVADNPLFAERFQREATAAARLDHPNIMRVYDFNRDGALAYMVTQLLEGEALSERLKRDRSAGQRMALNELVTIVAAIADGLQHAHSAGVVHRDIKPNNVMLLPDLRPVIMDFGISRIEESSMTSTNALLGTVRYMAPEQALGRPIDGRTDLYALGIVLFEMATGRFPYEAESETAILLMHMQTPVPDPRSLAPELPAGLAELIARAMAKDPADRFQSAAELAAALRALATPLPTPELRSANPTVVLEPPIPPGAAAGVLRYSPELRSRQLQHLLDDFLELFRSERAQQVVGRAFVRRIREQDRAIRQRLQAEFTLAVLGEFKRGKSTLINALLRTQLVTTDVTPETITLNRLRYGPRLKIEAQLPDGGLVAIDPADLRAEQLERVLERLPQSPEYLQIEAPVEWLRGMLLVDTPGLGDLFLRFDQKVQQYLPQADAVLYVISALSPLSETERAFLQSSLRVQEFPKLCFVVNMLDGPADAADAERVFELIQARLQRMFPGAPVFGISALDELCRVLGEAAPRPERSAELAASFRVLREHLDNAILLNRDMIRLDRATTQASQLIRDTLGGLERLRLALQSDQARLDTAISQCEDQHSELRQRILTHRQQVRRSVMQLADETAGWMVSFLDRLRTQVIEHLPRYSYEEIQRNFPFFLADSLRLAVTACVDAHQPVLLAGLNLQREVMASLNQYVAGAAPADTLDHLASKAGFDPGGWTTLDTLHMVASFTGIGGLLGQVVSGMVSMKGSTGAKTERYQAQLIGALPELQQAVASEVRQIYSTIADQLEQTLETTYQQQLEATLAALHQARELHGRGEHQTAMLAETLRDLIEQSTQMLLAVEEFQQERQAAEVA